MITQGQLPTVRRVYPFAACPGLSQVRERIDLAASVLLDIPEADGGKEVM